MLDIPVCIHCFNEEVPLGHVKKQAFTCSRMRTQTRKTRCLLGLSLVQYLVLNLSWITVLGISVFLSNKWYFCQNLSLRIPFLCSALKILLLNAPVYNAVILFIFWIQTFSSLLLLFDLVYTLTGLKFLHATFGVK